MLLTVKRSVQESAVCQKQPQSETDNGFKKRVAASFGKAAKTYDQAALLQQRVAARTRLLLPSSINPGCILDLGAGTGSETIQLAERYPSADIVGVDLAHPMMSFAQHSRPSGSVSWCTNDIEHLSFKAEVFDLVYSNMAIQWCDFERVVKGVQRVLKPGGYFVFSSLSAGTMEELMSAWQAVDTGSHVNTFDSFEEQKHEWRIQPGMMLVSASCKSEVVYYSDVAALLKALKAMGVNAVHGVGKGLMTGNKLKSLAAAYEAFRESLGLPLTYNVVYGLLRKDV